MIIIHKWPAACKAVSSSVLLGGLALAVCLTSFLRCYFSLDGGPQYTSVPVRVRLFQLVARELITLAEDAEYSEGEGEGDEEDGADEAALVNITWQSDNGVHSQTCSTVLPAHCGCLSLSRGLILLSSFQLLFISLAVGLQL